jgi:hypothetical protein
MAANVPDDVLPEARVDARTDGRTEQAWRLLRWLPRLVDIANIETTGTGLSVPLRWHGEKLQRVYSPRQR